MRHLRAAGSGLAAAALLALTVTPAKAAIDSTGFDGTESGAPGDRAARFMYEPGLAIVPEDLAAGEVAYLATDIQANDRATHWRVDTGTAGELSAVGLLRLDTRDPITQQSPLLVAADDITLITQHNSSGHAFGVNSKAYAGDTTASAWEWGTGTVYRSPLDASDQTTSVPTGGLRYEVWLSPDGSWTGTVTALDVDGDVIAAVAPVTFTGTVEADGVYAPFTRLRTGDTTNAPGYAPAAENWAYVINGSEFDAPVSDLAATIGSWDADLFGAGRPGVEVTVRNTGGYAGYYWIEGGSSSGDVLRVAGGSTEVLSVELTGPATVRVLDVTEEVLASAELSAPVVTPAPTPTPTPTPTATPAPVSAAARPAALAATGLELPAVAVLGAALLLAGAGVVGASRSR